MYLAAARELLRRPPPKPEGRGSTFRPSPGLQWTSDGKEIKVIVDGQTFTVNWQPTVDVGSVAFVGTVVRPEEDTAGVVGSFEDGVATTGSAPAALLLDNKACNKSAELKAALPDGTFVMHSTLGRPTNKAVIEGGFGNFAQELGPVIAIIDTSSTERVVRARRLGERPDRAHSNGAVTFVHYAEFIVMRS